MTSMKEIEDAHERAAHSARNGSAYVQSGRFDSDIEDLKQISQQVLHSAMRAQRLWAHWEAIDNAFAAPNKLADALYVDGLTTQIQDIRFALVERAALMAYALTDPDNGERATLTLLAKRIVEPSVLLRVTSKQWALDGGIPMSFADEAAKQSKEKLDQFIRMITPDWKKHPPADPTVMLGRTAIKLLRDGALAHFILDQSFSGPKLLDDVKQFIIMVTRLASDVCGVLTNSHHVGSSIDYSQSQADAFWQTAFARSLQRHQSLEAFDATQDGLYAPTSIVSPE